MLLDVEFPEYVRDMPVTVTAKVRLGKTSARGDDPDDVLSLFAVDEDGDWVAVDRQEFDRLCESAVIFARGEVI